VSAIVSVAGTPSVRAQKQSATLANRAKIEDIDR
jgi:hypothetical protein